MIRIMEYIAVVRRGMSTGYKTVEGHNSWVASRGTLLYTGKKGEETCYLSLSTSILCWHRCTARVQDWVWGAPGACSTQDLVSVNMYRAVQTYNLL
jgi:hypothetical protein